MASTIDNPDSVIDSQTVTATATTDCHSEEFTAGPQGLGPGLDNKNSSSDSGNGSGSVEQVFEEDAGLQSSSSGQDSTDVRVAINDNESRDMFMTAVLRSLSLNVEELTENPFDQIDATQQPYMSAAITATAAWKKITFADGRVFIGILDDGDLKAGRMTFPDGTVYQGEFCNSAINGCGHYIWMNNCEYVGQVRDGKRCGIGTFTIRNTTDNDNANANANANATTTSDSVAAVYEGEWNDGKRHGKGVLYYNDERTSFYDGEWHNDARHGHGMMQYVSGSQYDGEWRNNRKHGKGTMRWVNKQQEYTGEWCNDMPNGIGEYHWFGNERKPSAPGTNKFVGSFKNGLRNGIGTMYYSNGKATMSKWENNKEIDREHAVAS
jgi:hypothetical protein